jgi:hypothetical protein
MNNVITRAKELIDLYGAVTAICEAANAIDIADNDERNHSTPFHLEFYKNDAGYVVERLISIARNSAAIRPSIEKETGIIIENLQVLKQEYDRLKEAEFEDEPLKGFPDVFDVFFEDLAKAVGHHPDYMEFNPFGVDGWMNLYWDHFNSFADSIIQHIAYGTEDFNFLPHEEIVEVLKIATSKNQPRKARQ